MILISAQAEQDYLDLLEDGPAIGFLSKSRFSAQAIIDLLETCGSTAGCPNRSRWVPTTSSRRC